MDSRDRLYDISQRLLAWSFAGDQVPEVFQEACRRFEERVVDYEDFNQVDYDILLTIFEEALDSFDNILRAFPQEPED